MSRVSADGCSVLLLYPPRRGPITRAFLIRAACAASATTKRSYLRIDPVRIQSQAVAEDGCGESYRRAVSTILTCRLPRIGLNLDDVIADGDDVLGDGVNVAARLETLAEPSHSAGFWHLRPRCSEGLE